VDHANAAQAALEAAAEKLREQRPRPFAVQAVQIDRVLNDPMPSPQPEQNIAAETVAQVAELFARLDRLVPGKGTAHALGERVMPVE
jgi:hypothetical protein